MTDIELVIKIPEDKFSLIINKLYCGIYDPDLYKAIANGTPLPKGHGDLIDRKELLENKYEIDSMYCEYDEVVNVDDIKDATPIIEADKAESEVTYADCD